MVDKKEKPSLVTINFEKNIKGNNAGKTLFAHTAIPSENTIKKRRASLAKYSIAQTASAEIAKFLSDTRRLSHIV